MAALIKKLKFIFYLLGFLVFLGLLILILDLVNYQKVAQGVMIAGQNIGGLKYEQAKSKIGQLAKKAESEAFELQYQNKNWRLSPLELGVFFDIEQTAKNAYEIGRQKKYNLLGKTLDQLEALLGYRKQQLIFRIEKQKIQDFIKSNLSEMESPAKNAGLVYDANLDDFVLLPAQKGQVFDKEDIAKQINKQIAESKRQPIVMKKISQEPVLKEDKNNFAKIKAKQILVLAPYQINYASTTWPVEKHVLLDWLDFVPFANSKEQTMDVAISESAIKDFLSALAPDINKMPVNAKLSVQDGKVIAFALSQNGRELEIDESAKKIAKEVIDGENEIELIVKETEPQISTKTIDMLGLTDLLGQGVSDFAGSPKNRIHNIGVGATKINHVLIEPGQEFSFVESIGEIEAEQGYLPELVIKNGKTVPEYGGGLCQISTTLFRAAVNSGLKITERYPHAFPVKYYNPQGFDATVYPPHPDLRFLNDTQNNILIQSKIEKTKITFEFYGTKDGREVKIIGPKILQSNPDGSMKTVLYQEIWRDGVLERKDSFWSNYKSPALYPVERNPLE